MANQNDEMSVEELQSAIRIFAGLNWFVVFLNFCAIGIGIYAGFRGWDWRLTLPIWAMVWFSLRVLKRYFRNIASSFETDLQDQLNPREISETESHEQEVSLDDNRFGFSGISSAALAAIAMIVVASLWYGIGALADWIVSS